MKKSCIYTLAILLLSCSAFADNGSSPAENNLKTQMADSLVYVDAYFQPYNQYQPWRKENVGRSSFYATAVGEYQVIASARSVAGASYLKVRKFGQNKFIKAQVSVVDYEQNLCVIELDPASLETPLKPVRFADYKQGSDLELYWLTSNGQVEKARAVMDRADIGSSPTSHCRMMVFIASNTSREAGWNEAVMADGKLVGIATWFNSSNSQAGIIPSLRIERFLEAATAAAGYKGFGLKGFDASALIDPAVRKSLGMDPESKNGMYVSDVFTLGTGSTELKKGDVILAIDSHDISGYGKYRDAVYEDMIWEELITSRPAGTKIAFRIFRDGKEQTIEVTAKNFSSEQMLVPWYEYGQQPEFLIHGGFVFQKLTRPYMEIYGSDWSGKVPPFIYQFYRNSKFSPSDEKRQVILLSFVLPVDANLGYHGLGQLVVKSVNGVEIKTITDLYNAIKFNPDPDFDIIELEQENPTIVIDKSQLATIESIIRNRYGVTKTINIRELEK